MEELGLIKEIFKDKAICLGEFLGRNNRKSVCKNKHLVYSIPSGTKVAVKIFSNLESAEREVAAYDFFNRNELVKVPRVYGYCKGVLVTEFLEPEDINLRSVIEDWARVHSKTIGIGGFDIFPFYDDYLHLIENEKYLGEFAGSFIKKISSKPKIETMTLTHGDLYINNILSKRGTPYYIDFEKFGLRHPANDLALLLFNHSEHFEKLIKIYTEAVEYDSTDLVRDIKFFYTLRLGKVIVDLSLDKKLPKVYKEEFILKAKSQLRNILMSHP